MPIVNHDAFAFGPFRLNLRDRSLTRDGVAVAVGARALDMLAVLAAADGKLVSKDALLDQVCSRVAAAENNLHAQIYSLRRALGAESIATVRGRGY